MKPDPAGLSLGRLVAPHGAADLHDVHVDNARFHLLEEFNGFVLFGIERQRGAGDAKFGVGIVKRPAPSSQEMAP